MTRLLASLVFTAVLMARETPPLSFTVPSHGATTLEQLRDHVVALEFGYSTCKPCQAVAERLDRMAAEFGPRGLRAFEVMFDPNAPQLVAGIAKQQKLSLPIAWASGDTAMRFLGYTGSDRPVVPQIVLLDGSGRIRFQTAAQGSDPLRTDSGLRARILELLGAHPGLPSTRSSR